MKIFVLLINDDPVIVGNFKFSQLSLVSFRFPLCALLFYFYQNNMNFWPPTNFWRDFINSGEVEKRKPYSKFNARSISIIIQKTHFQCNPGKKKVMSIKIYFHGSLITGSARPASAIEKVGREKRKFAFLSAKHTHVLNLCVWLVRNA